MILVLVSAVLGICAAIAFDLYIPAAMSTYIAVFIIAALDSVMGAYKALLRDKFDTWVFVTGFFGSSLLAALMVYLGKKIDLDLYHAVLVVFTLRVFNNFACIRRYYLKNIKQKFKKC